VRGEVAAEVLTDFPSRLKALSSVELRHPSAAAGANAIANGVRKVAVLSCKLTASRGGQALFLFEGCRSIDDAKKLLGMEVQIPLADRLPLPGGSYYVTDLIGCAVRDESGAEIGKIRDVDHIGESVRGAPLLVVEDVHGGEMLIPLAQDICVDVNLAGRSVIVRLPQGLSDLNRSSS
jgi:16S rRNA processing protein RimM